MPTRSAVQKTDADETVEATKHTTDNSPGLKIKKVPVTLVVDNSNAKIDWTHFMAMGVWLGWSFFYLCFMWGLPLLWLYAKPFAFYDSGNAGRVRFHPIDSRKQPKVRDPTMAL